MRFDFQIRVRRLAGFVLDVSESCEAEALALVGPSGSGKSTILDAIAGIEAGGQVCLDGIDCSQLPLEKREMGYVTQEALLFPHLSVAENLLYGVRAKGLGDVPDALGIKHLLDRKPRNLSGGERRRAALARAILSRPRVLLLDEPFGGLDETRRREAMSLLDQVRRTFRLPMILVSHLADEVIGLADWAIRLDQGRVVGRGPSTSVLRASETKVDNYFEGVVSGQGRVRVGSNDLFALIPRFVTGAVRLACYAHDVLLATSEPSGISARNVYRTRVVAIEKTDGSTDGTTDGGVLVEIDNPRLRALVTPEAVRSLALKPGADVFAILKATSIAYLGPK